MKEKLVSVILLAESNDDDDVLHVVKNIKSQTHKNIDLIISTFKEVSDDLKEKCQAISIGGIRWIQQDPQSDFFRELLDKVDGEVVFYKTLNNILWHPRHIQAHLEEMKNNNTKWCFSHVEYKKLDMGDHPYNVLNYRVTNAPQPDKVSMDEVCHAASLHTEWTNCLRQDEDGNPYFIAGYVAKTWIEAGVRGSIPPEITVVNWVDTNSNQNQNNNNLNEKLQSPVLREPEEDQSVIDGEIVIRRKWPTLVGNLFYEAHNNYVMEQFEKLTDPAEVKTIAIKRTMGMGDVLVVEPIIKKLKQKYPNAVITFFTAETNIVKYFGNKPDIVEEIERDKLLIDFLSDFGHDLRFDLDLSYESREQISFVDAYAKICFVEFDNQEDKHVQFDTSSLQKIESDKPVAIVAADGSGWPGKTWPITYYESVIEHLQEKNYEVIETGNVVTDMTDEKYHGCDFETFINCIYSCDLFVGADNGPMHVARALNKKCVTIAGAALPYLTTPNRKDIYYVEDSVNDNWGMKHNFFFRMDGDSISFVPYDEKDDTACGIRMIEPEYVISAIDKITRDDFAFSMFGALVKKDVVGGIAYYKSEFGLEREIKYYHPDQRIDLSQYYENDTEGYAEKYLTEAQDFVSTFDKESKVLDVGCNMGILLNNITSLGYTDVRGIDINTNSVNKGKQQFEAVNISHADFLDDSSYTDKYDAIVCADVIAKTHDPLKLLQNIKNHIHSDGKVFVSVELFDIDYVDQRDERLSIGENHYLYSDDSIKKLFEKADFTVDSQSYNDNSGFTSYILKPW